MFRKTVLCISTLFLPLVFSGCFFVNMFDFGPSINLAKHNWKISSFVLVGEVFEAKNLEQIPTMRFDTEELKVYGNTGCNAFFANYVWLKDKDDTIEMRNSGMTRKMCASKEAMKFEQKLMEEFDGEFQVIEEGENLILKKETLVINLTPYDPSQEGEEQKQDTPTSEDVATQSK